MRSRTSALVLACSLGTSMAASRKTAPAMQPQDAKDPRHISNCCTLLDMRGTGECDGEYQIDSARAESDGHQSIEYTGVATGMKLYTLENKWVCAKSASDVSPSVVASDNTRSCPEGLWCKDSTCTNKMVLACNVPGDAKEDTEARKVDIDTKAPDKRVPGDPDIPTHVTKCPSHTSECATNLDVRNAGACDGEYVMVTARPGAECGSEELPMWKGQKNDMMIFARQGGGWACGSSESVKTPVATAKNPSSSCPEGKWCTDAGCNGIVASPDSREFKFDDEAKDADKMLTSPSPPPPPLTTPIVFAPPSPPPADFILAPPSSSVGGSGLCFDKSTAMACKVEPSVAALSARVHCFGTDNNAVPHPPAALVPMATLRAGDLVLTSDLDGVPAVTKVVVNQHASTPDAPAAMLSIQTHDGTIVSLTPDHALYVDGALAAARDVRVGSTLTDSIGRPLKVSAVTAYTATGIINPVTVAGTVLAADAASAHGRAVLAAAHPIWLAAQFIRGQVALPLSTVVSSAFPSTTQAYYDMVVEPIGAMCTQHLVDLSARAPQPALLVGLLIVDMLLALGFTFFAACLALVTFSKVLAICAVVATVGKRHASRATTPTKRSS